MKVELISIRSINVGKKDYATLKHKIFKNRVVVAILLSRTNIIRVCIKLGRAMNDRKDWEISTFFRQTRNLVQKNAKKKQVQLLDYILDYVF